MEQSTMQKLKALVPALLATRYKGQNGKIGVIGGSPNYTGAPYYAAISALYGGADLTYIFCHEQAQIPIKSYSPEIIVYPILKDIESQVSTMLQSIQDNGKMLNSVIIGCGLGRDKIIINSLSQIMDIFKDQITVMDADSLWILSQSDILQAHGLKKLILTPNRYEFGLLWSRYMQGEIFQADISEGEGVQELENHDVKRFAEKMNCSVVLKGQFDIVTDGRRCYVVREKGGLKRSGGQGDILAGLVGLYGFWGDQYEGKDGILNGMILASIITKRASFKAFEEHYYSLTAPKVIEQIGKTFQEFHKSNL